MQTATVAATQVSGVYRAMVEARSARENREIVRAFETLLARLTSWTHEMVEAVRQGEAMNASDVASLVSGAKSLSTEDRVARLELAATALESQKDLRAVLEDAVAIMSKTSSSASWLASERPHSSGTVRTLAKDIDAATARVCDVLGRLLEVVEENIDLGLVLTAALDPENDEAPISLAELEAKLDAKLDAAE